MNNKIILSAIIIVLLGYIFHSMYNKNTGVIPTGTTKPVTPGGTTPGATTPIGTTKPVTPGGATPGATTPTSTTKPASTSPTSTPTSTTATTTTASTPASFGSFKDKNGNTVISSSGTTLVSGYSDNGITNYGVRAQCTTSGKVKTVTIVFSTTPPGVSKDYYITIANDSSPSPTEDGSSYNTATNNTNILTVTGNTWVINIPTAKYITIGEGNMLAISWGQSQTGPAPRVSSVAVA